MLVKGMYQCGVCVWVTSLVDCVRIKCLCACVFVCLRVCVFVFV